MGKKLVLFYSRTGNTRKAAKRLAGELSCEVVEIISSKSFKGPIGWLSAGGHAMGDKSIEISVPEIDPKEYDSIVLCSPVWASHLATPPKNWFKENFKNYNSLAFLFTHGGGDVNGLRKELEIITGEDIKYIDFSGTELKGDGWVERLRLFAEKL